MTTYTKFKEYIWLVNTIYHAKAITFADINRKWLQTDMSEGTPFSGRLLDAGLAERLEILWAEFLKEHQEMFVIRAAQRQLDSSEYKLYLEKEITIYLNLTIEGKINAYHGGFDLDIKKS